MLDDDVRQLRGEADVFVVLVAVLQEPGLVGLLQGVHEDGLVVPDGLLDILVGDGAEGPDVVLLLILVDLGNEANQAVLVAVDHGHAFRGVDLEVEEVPQVGRQVDDDDLQKHHAHKGEEILGEGGPLFVVEKHDGDLEIGDQVGDHRGDENGIDDLPAFLDADGEAAVNLDKADPGHGKGGHGNGRRPGRPPELPLVEAEKAEENREKHHKEQPLESQEERPLELFNKLFNHKSGYPFLHDSQRFPEIRQNL